jgi:putative transcriptional regulator
MCGRLRSRRPSSGNILPDWRNVDDARTIGESVRAARKYAGLTQGDLADLAGVSERTVRAIETGAGNPSLAAVIAVVNTLGLHLAAA